MKENLELAFISKSLALPEEDNNRMPIMNSLIHLFYWQEMEGAVKSRNLNWIQLRGKTGQG